MFEMNEKHMGLETNKYFRKSKLSFNAIVVKSQVDELLSIN